MENQVEKSFIRIIKKGLNTRQMMIPSSLVYFDEVVSRNVILIGPSGDYSGATISKKDGIIYMQKGWPQFLRNNLITENELLLFTYERENCFQVQIFDVNGLERQNTKTARQLDTSRHIFRHDSTRQTRSAAKVSSSYFTVFIHKLYSESLSIPNEFLKLANLKERVPKLFVLRNYSEVGWTMRARRVGSNVHFVDGWKQFVADNCLEEEDFIFFKYDGKYEMKFKTLKLHEWEQTEENDEGINAIDNECMQTKNEVQEEQYDESEEQIGRNHHRAGKASVGKGKTATSSARKNCANIKYVDNDNPHFTAVVQKGRENELRVPRKLIGDLSLNLPQKITLLCCEHDGRNDVHYHQHTFPEETHIRKNRGTVIGELQRRKDGRTFYKGWSRFCRTNNINIYKDECICEFVKGEDQQIQMLQVHVVKN